MSKSKRTIGRGIANDASKRLGQSRDFWEVDDYLAARIDRAVRAAFNKGWCMRMEWDSQHERGAFSKRDAIYDAARNFNRPAKRSRK